MGLWVCLSRHYVQPGGSRHCHPNTQIVFDERDHLGSFGKYIKRLADYWQERLGRNGIPSVLEREQVLKCIRPGFDFRPFLGAGAKEINTELIRLTQEHYDALMMPSIFWRKMTEF